MRQFIDEIAYQPEPFVENKYIEINNLMLKIDFNKEINQEYLANVETAHTIYTLKDKVREGTRVPLHGLIKYKGFKVMVRALTPIDKYSHKDRENRVLHGVCEESWKTHFFIQDDLLLISQTQNMKPYNS